MIPKLISVSHNFFVMLKNLGKNKNIQEGLTKMLICTTYKLKSKINSPEAAKIATFVNFFNVVKTWACLVHQYFDIATSM